MIGDTKKTVPNWGPRPDLLYLLFVKEESQSRDDAGTDDAAPGDNAVMLRAQKSALGAVANTLALRRLLTGAEVAAIMTANPPRRLTSRRRA
jgi:hypothetical protein